MNKSLLAVLVALFVMSATAHSLDEVKKAFLNDKCIADELTIVKPQIEAKVAQLKLVTPPLPRTRRTWLPRPS
ncbi:MAG: hypothetical protein QM758_23040 [Armatimonas sp.]